jgi:hypothetical protein
MAKKSEEKRERMFDLFSNNLQLVCNAPGVTPTMDLTGIYICPLCMGQFTKDALKSDSPNPLTFEDVPPKSLGGRVRTLTCKECNNVGGQKVDIHVVNVLKNMDFSAFSPNSGAPVKFKTSEGEVNGRVDVNAEGTVVINVDTKSSHPKHAKELDEHVESKKHSIDGVPLSFAVTQKKADERTAEIALLRIAYLTAFSIFGYGFILDDNLRIIRHQILNPEKEIIPRLTPIQLRFPEEDYGLNFISSPSELRCFLVIFDLVTSSRSYQFAIPLPAPLKSGLAIYDNIREELAKGNKKCTFEHIPEGDYLRDGELVTHTLGLWKADMLEEEKNE